MRSIRTAHSLKSSSATVLGSGDRFADWIKSRIERYKFQENQDFVCVSVNTETQRKSGQHGISKRIDYHITLNMAKQLAWCVTAPKDASNAPYLATWLQHKTILQSVDKYTTELQQFGEVVFKRTEELPQSLQTLVLERRGVGGEVTRYALC